jgi:nucleotide-binding universal stress UspA family protein
MAIIAAVSRDPDARIVEHAARLAAAFEEELQIVNVLQLSEFVDLESEAMESAGQPKAMDEVRERAERFAAAAAEGVTDSFTAVGLVGEPATEIVRHAAETDTTYLVVGGRKRSPTGKAIFGSTTQSILLNAESPVLTVMAE